MLNFNVVQIRDNLERRDENCKIFGTFFLKGEKAKIEVTFRFVFRDT